MALPLWTRVLSTLLLAVLWMDRLDTARAEVSIGLNLIRYLDEFQNYSNSIKLELWDANTGQKTLDFQPHGPHGSDPFFPPSAWAESVDAITIGPDNYLYAAGNNLGFIDVVSLNTVTGFQVEPPFEVFASFFDGPVTDMQHSPGGDLYVSAIEVVRRFDGNTGNFIEEFQVGSGNRHTRAIDFSTDGSSLYVLHSPRSVPAGGSFDRLVSTYQRPANIETAMFSVGTGATDMILGPDGLFYVSDPVADAVVRYTTDGQFVYQFINTYVFDLTYAEGRLFGLTGDRVLEINPSTGSIVRTILDGAPGPECEFGCVFSKMVAFTTVPEPTTLVLALFGLTVCAIAKPKGRFPTPARNGLKPTSHRC